MPVPPLSYDAPDASIAGPWQELWPTKQQHCHCGQPRMYGWERWPRCGRCKEQFCSRGCLAAHRKERHG